MLDPNHQDLNIVFRFHSLLISDENVMLLKTCFQHINHLCICLIHKVEHKLVNAVRHEADVLQQYEFNSGLGSYSQLYSKIVLDRQN